MSEPVDKVSIPHDEATRASLLRDPLYAVEFGMDAIAQLRECGEEIDRLQSALTAAQQRLSEQETLLAERNRQNAACFEDADRFRALERMDSVAFVELCERHRGIWNLRAAIDAAMGAKEGK